MRYRMSMVVRCLFFALLGAACQGSALQPGDGRLEVKGGSIFYRVVGSGPGTPVILLHGGPGYSSHYLEPLGALGNERPVIMYDQLSSGRSDLLQTLQVPILFTAGRNDEARPATVERFASLTSNAEVKIFENSAHIPMITEREAYVAAIREFLRRAVM